MRALPVPGVPVRSGVTSWQAHVSVFYWYYDDPSLDHLGCDWHPSHPLNW